MRASAQLRGWLTPSPCAHPLATAEHAPHPSHAGAHAVWHEDRGARPARRACEAAARHAAAARESRVVCPPGSQEARLTRSLLGSTPLQGGSSYHATLCRHHELFDDTGYGACHGAWAPPTRVLALGQSRAAPAPTAATPTRADMCGGPLWRPQASRATWMEASTGAETRWGAPGRPWHGSNLLDRGSNTGHGPCAHRPTGPPRLPRLPPAGRQPRRRDLGRPVLPARARPPARKREDRPSSAGCWRSGAHPQGRAHVRPPALAHCTPPQPTNRFTPTTTATSAAPASPPLVRPQLAAHQACRGPSDLDGAACSAPTLPVEQPHPGPCLSADDCAKSSACPQPGVPLCAPLVACVKEPRGRVGCHAAD